MHGDDGKLRHAGNVGTGFNERTLRELRTQLDAIASKRNPFDAGSGWARGAHWVEPELVAEVSFGEWTRDGKVRHSVFHGLRGDKPAGEISIEAPVRPPPAAAPAPARGKPARRAKSAAAVPPRTPEPGLKLPPTLRVSNPDRVVDARSGLTKIDLVRYYALVAPLMMEHLRRRPIALVRAPDGVDGQLFFQKHLQRYRMPGVEQLDPAIFPGHPPMLEIASGEGLLSAAQMNVIEFHTWNAVADRPDQPDRMTLDLDPGDGVEWPRMQEAAELVRAFLQELSPARLAQDQRRQGPARGGAAAAAARLGRGEGLLAGDRGASGQHPAAALRRQERAEEPGRAHLHRLPAQRLRRHHRRRLVGTGPARFGHFRAGALGRTAPGSRVAPTGPSPACTSGSTRATRPGTATVTAARSWTKRCASWAFGPERPWTATPTSRPVLVGA